MPLRWLLKYQIRTDFFIKKVTCPIFIVHGKKDRLITFKQSLLLKKQAPKEVHLFPVEEAGHNNLPEFSVYHEWLYDILNDEFDNYDSTIYVEPLEIKNTLKL